MKFCPPIILLIFMRTPHLQSISIFIFPVCKIRKNNIDKISIYHERVPESQIYCNSSASRQGSPPAPSQTSQLGRDSLGSLPITSGWEGGKDPPLNSYPQEIPSKVFSIKETLIAKTNLKLVILFIGYTIILLLSFFYYKKTVTEGQDLSFDYF